MRSRLTSDSFILTRPIAHRGLHNKIAPENSLAAFSRAVAGNFPIETDVQMSADGRLVLFHDDDLSRMTGLNTDIRDESYEKIKSLALADTNERIPDFEELLSLVCGKVPLLIEIKQQKQKGIEKKIVKALEGYGGEYAVQSFDPTVLIAFKKFAPDVLRGQLASGAPPELGFIKKYVIKHTPLNFLTRPDFVNYDLDSLPTAKRNYNGLPLICWTVATKTQKEKAQSLGINYVFENVFDLDERVNL